MRMRKKNEEIMKEYYNDKNEWKTRPAVSKLPLSASLFLPFLVFPQFA